MKQLVTRPEDWARSRVPRSLRLYRKRRVLALGLWSQVRQRTLRSPTRSPPPSPAPCQKKPTRDTPGKALKDMQVTTNRVRHPAFGEGMTSVVPQTRRIDPGGTPSKKAGKVKIESESAVRKRERAARRLRPVGNIPTQAKGRPEWAISQMQTYNRAHPHARLTIQS